MVEYAPCTGGLALWVQHRDLAAEPPEEPSGTSGKTTSPVLTDGVTLMYRASFDRLPLDVQTGHVAHEVLHIALRHPQRYLELKDLLGDVDLELFNVCADAIVNSTLAHASWLALPAGAVTLELLLRRVLSIDQGAEKSLLDWDVERLYRAIDDRSGSAGGGRTGRRAGGAGSGDEGNARSEAAREGPRAALVRALSVPESRDLAPDAGRREAPETKADAVRTWGERILRAHAGDGAHSLLRVLIADVARSRTPWEQVLRHQLARCLAPILEVSWSRPTRSYLANQGRVGARRMPWSPGFRSSKAVLKLVLIVDVSGSIEGTLMQRFAREIDAITRRLEAALVMIVGDDRVRRIEQFEPGHSDWSRLEFPGGGGTDFTPLLEAADAHRPDVAVVLTDLDGPARRQPRFPVIWAVPEEDAHRPAPFGRKLVLSA